MDSERTLVELRRDRRDRRDGERWDGAGEAAARYLRPPSDRRPADRPAAPTTRRLTELSGGDPERRERSTAEPSTVAGRYELLGEIAAGGFGVVYHAWDAQLQRDVALKLIDTDALQREPAGAELAERAHHEALAAARLAHPAIAALYEALIDDGRLCLISELVDGSTLRELQADHALTEERICEIGECLCEALAHAHQRGVVHGDVTPANIIVCAPESSPSLPAAKLTDFGSALLAPGGRAEAQTLIPRLDTDGVVGTLAYMSPEQRHGRTLSAQSDLYSAALILYEAFAKVNPLRAAVSAPFAESHSAAIEPLGSRRPDLPMPLCAAIDRALSARPDRRGSLEDLRAQLAAQRTGTGRPVPAPAAQSAGSTRRLTRRSAPLRRELPRRPAPAEPRSSRQTDPSLAAPAQPGATERSPAARRRAPIRLLAWPAAVSGIVWLAASGRDGAALLAGCALLPLLALLSLRLRTGLRAIIALGVLPLGIAGLAGAFPAIAGQLRSWHERAAAAALGCWWLICWEALTGKLLWLWPKPRTGPPAASKLGLATAWHHAIAPCLSLPVLGVLTIWAVAAALLPWLVRGRNAARDIVAATIWSALLATSIPVALRAGQDVAPAGVRGALAGAVLAGVIAVTARALRGSA